MQERKKPLGIMQVPTGGYPDALKTIAGDWLERWPGLPVMACGMIGSTQGWREAPYVPCPARVEDLASGLMAFEALAGVRLHIVPGVSKSADLPDVMRGEETQIFGTIAADPALYASSRLLHPGTHAKWVEVRDGAIQSFATYLTGELFAVLRNHSILGRPAKAAAIQRNVSEPETWRKSFARGVTAARDNAPSGSAPLLFSTRSLVLAGALPAAESLDYLSGVLIGDEIRCAHPADGFGGELVIIGEPALCERYRYALELFGTSRTRVLEDSAVEGIWQIAKAAALLPLSP